MGKSWKKAKKIMVIRNAEKPSRNPLLYGVTDQGRRDKECLSIRGWQRAGALVGFFAPPGGAPRVPQIAKPEFLYASKPTRRNGSQRPQDTIKPLSKKLAVKINARFSKLEPERMLDQALSNDGVVLICWQQEFIPQIANYILGDETTAPQDWPDNRFDMVWVFDLDRSSDKYRLKQIPQRLLKGDKARPIK